MLINRKVHFIISFGFIFCTSNIYAQKQNNLWYFGWKAGVDFNSGEPALLNTGKTNTWEAIAVISDSAGNLLFYSSGDTVWNAQHQIMDNGTGLGGGISSTQMAIVPNPDSSKIYYLIYMNYLSHDLMYAVIDMSKNVGLGKVRKKQIFLYNPVTEKIVACLKSDLHNYWLLTHEYGTNKFLCYSIDKNGINPTPTESSIGSVHSGAYNQSIGYMKISRNKEFLALNQALVRETAIFKFDDATGKVSGNISFKVASNTIKKIYSLEFSPNSKYLYVGTDTGIVQLNLAVYDSAFVWASRKIISNAFVSAMQLGPDNNLYVMYLGQFGNYIIRYPHSDSQYPVNITDIDTLYEPQGVIFGLGLPALVPYPPYQFSFQPDTGCEEKAVIFDIYTTAVVDSVKWQFGDGHSLLVYGQNALHTEHVYNNAGVFTVCAKIYNGFNIDTICTNYYINPKPEAWFANDSMSLCNVETITLDPTIGENVSLIWNTGDTSKSIDVNAVGVYSFLAVNHYGCTITDSIMVLNDCKCNLFVPNIFSPNNDGVNDKFVPFVMCTNAQVIFKVFDRWGNIVYEESGSTIQGWNGRKAGYPASSGVYTWMVILSRAKTQVRKSYSGNISLIR